MFINLKGTIKIVCTNAYNQVTNTKIVILNISSTPKVPRVPLESVCYSHLLPLANIATFCHYSFTFSRISYNRIIDNVSLVSGFCFSA